MEANTLQLPLAAHEINRPLDAGLLGVGGNKGGNRSWV